VKHISIFHSLDTLDRLTLLPEIDRRTTDTLPPKITASITTIPMTEVQVIPTTIDINIIAQVTEEKRDVYASVNARAALLSVSSSPAEKSCSPLKTMVQSMGLPSPPAEDTTFPNNGPGLLQGHPDIHIRNGIIRAALALDAQKADAEAAFFVADLGQVYRQHLRWEKCLPSVQPFYGA
jgi:ornithine decarboxylase